MKAIIVSMFLFASILSPSLTQAHDILPEPVLQYLQEHPQATSEEIEQFIDQTFPDGDQQKAVSRAQIIQSAKDEQLSFWSNLVRWIRLGVEHILIGPDHILFVLSLVLISLNLKQILKLVTSFTIAHSITFILAGTAVLTLTPRVVEPLIALSISYVAFTSVFLKDAKGKWGEWFRGSKNKVATVFFFGLFHGLGFAGLLQELHVPQTKFVSSLLAFNIGIELGQLCIIVLALPIFYIIKNKPWYPLFLKGFSLAISAIGLFWFAQRVVG